MKPRKKMLMLVLAVVMAMPLVCLPVCAEVGDVYDYVAELSGTQGGTSGAWFYEYLESADTSSGYRQDAAGGDQFVQYRYFGLSNTAWPNAKVWSNEWSDEGSGLVNLRSAQGSIGANWCWAGFTRVGFDPVATFVAPESGYVQLAMEIRGPQSSQSNGVQFQIVKYSADNRRVQQVYPQSGWQLLPNWTSGGGTEYNEFTGIYASVSKGEKLCLIFNANENSAGDEFAITQYTVRYIEPIAFDQAEYYAAYYTDPAYADQNFVDIPATLVDGAAGTVEYSSSDPSVLFPVDNAGRFSIVGNNVTHNGGTSAGYERQAPVVVTASLMQDGQVTAQASTDVYVSENPISPNAESYVWSHKAQNLSDYPIWSYQSATLADSLDDIQDVTYSPMSLEFYPHGAEDAGLGWYRYSGSGGNFRLDIVNSGLSTAADAALTFTAPRSGLIRVSGSADDRLTRSSAGNGIGIAIRLQQGETKTQIYPTDSLWQTVTSSPTEYTYFSYPDQYLEVNAGDKLYFVANALGNNNSDTYYWQPSVTYVEQEHVESAVITEDNQVLVSYNLIPEFSNQKVSVIGALKDGEGRLLSARLQTAAMTEGEMSQFAFTFGLDNPFQYQDLYFYAYVFDDMEAIRPLKTAYQEEISRSPDPSKWQRIFNRAGITDITYFSEAMGIDVNALVWVPDDYEANPEKRYPVLYYMHGRGGSCIEPFDTIAKSIQAAIEDGTLEPMIIVSVNGGNNSWYMDTLDAYSKPRTAFLNELLPYIDSHYRTIPTREGRMLAGFSMGGFGSTSIAFEHPDLFAGAVTFGAAVYTTEEFIGRWSSDFAQVFDGRTSILDRWNPYALLEKNAQRIQDSQLKLYLFVGNNDFTKEFNERFSAKLTEEGVAHELINAGDAEHNMSQYHQLVGEQVVLKIADIFGQSGNGLQ